MYNMEKKGKRYGQVIGEWWAEIEEMFHLD
jgi:hypothetical protein